MAKEKLVKRVVFSIPRAIWNKGFAKAFFYSVGSFIAGWVILYLGTPEAAYLFGRYAWIVPLLNVVFVAAKQWIDEMRSST